MFLIHFYDLLIQNTHNMHLNQSIEKKSNQITRKRKYFMILSEKENTSKFQQIYIRFEF